MDMTKEMIEINVPLSFTQERISDLLCSAFEGGSNYWYEIVRYKFAKGKAGSDYKYKHIEVPFDGGAIIICDKEDPTTQAKLDKAAIVKGLELMADKYPDHFKDWVDENADAETGDVFLQLCLFNEIVFG
tara:strand:- start:1538 stop:1927 length:390 start_codon:yes stop_codon:yes gene_type:complete